MVGGHHQGVAEHPPPQANGVATPATPAWTQRRAAATAGAPAVPSPQAVSLLWVVQPPEKAAVFSSAANELGGGGGPGQLPAGTDTSGCSEGLAESL